GHRAPRPRGHGCRRHREVDRGTAPPLPPRPPRDRRRRAGARRGRRGRRAARPRGVLAVRPGHLCRGAQQRPHAAHPLHLPARPGPGRGRGRGGPLPGPGERRPDDPSSHRGPRGCVRRPEPRLARRLRRLPPGRSGAGPPHAGAARRGAARRGGDPGRGRGLGLAPWVLSQSPRM
ncbi:MAG: hypothetical protein AVDCRST_MAG60-1326, partial [uncultured Nocardioides sp.]